MSTPFLLRKALSETESPLLIASGGSYFFRSINICNSHNATVKVYLAVTAGRAFAQQGDWLLYDYSISSTNTFVIENVLVPDGHELRGYVSSGHGAYVSVVGSGVLE
jgi:hypothetical protein|tara:strand:+ start:244 stop:564 length:321 start_codon:yes stop_codon:yes gene_type:complete